MGDRDQVETGSRCPRWCRGDHRTQDHRDDRHHQSPARRVAVITGGPPLEPDDQAVPCAVVARLLRRADSWQTWVELVSEEGHQVRMVVTAESARRLHAVLGELVDLT
jgi:hypothetical protein